MKIATILAGPILICALVVVHAGDQKRKPFGIDKRLPWTTSKLKGSLQPPAPFKIERVFGKLNFDHPTDVSRCPGSDRLFVLELNGKIYSFPARPDADKADLFGDVSSDVEGERRAYGIAFHPNFVKNRYCYVCYILKRDLPQGTRVSRFKVRNTDPPQLDPKSEKVLLTWKSGGHNGGCLKFGPDGFLYVSAGDGGPAFPPDPIRTGQDVSDLLGCILRIDVDHSTDDVPYRIPADNPFAGKPGLRGEVWAYGMRNPWKMSFDPVTKALWVGDVGWELWEMIYRVERGGNYGWSLVEGRQPVHQEGKRGPTPILPPTVEHSHTEARSITGGYVYRGKRLPKLVGAYIYGDYVTGKIWAVRHDGKKVTSQQELVDTPLQVICFAIDNADELYIVGYDGTFFRLVENPSTGINREFPRKLSDTGLFSSVKDHTLAAGVLPYSINAEPWMDGAVAERFLGLPGTTRLGVHKKTNVWIGHIKDEWAFPDNAVLGKTIALDMQQNNPATRRRLETQILHLDGDTWNAYTYIWNDAQTDAFLAKKEGFDRTFTILDAEAPGGKRKQTWHFASRTECILCHTTRAGSIHGFNLGQLKRKHRYASVAADQLATLDHVGLFKESLPTTPTRFPSPYDASAPLDRRARAYLHVNCAHCHRRGGGGTAAIDIQYKFDLKRTNVLDARPTQGTFGLHQAQVVAPGDPYRSMLYYRMAKIGRGRMPHFGSTVVDKKGLRLIADWIRQLPAKQDTPESVVNLRNKQQEILARLATKKSADLSKDVDTLLSSTSGALRALEAIDRDRLPAGVRKLIVARAAKQEPQVRDLFERFLPDSLKRKRLGDFIKPAQILTRRGNPDIGRKLFFESKVMQCRNCHRVNGNGIELGPDLTKIGKKLTRAKLLESILNPSKNVERKYVSYLAETRNGMVHTGLLVRKDEKKVVLRSPQNKLLELAAKDVVLITPLRRSIMPERLVSDMTAQELADLLSFLESLK